MQNIISLSSYQDNKTKQYQEYLKGLDRSGLIQEAQQLACNDSINDLSPLSDLVRMSSSLIEVTKERISEDSPQLKNELTGIHENLVSQLKSL